MNFEHYLRDRTADYSPRPWLFDRVGAWLTSPSSRYLLVTAEPGGGKTALAAQVVLASRGQATASPIPLGAIAAHHFCASTDAGWLDPLSFSHSISAQLVAAVPGFEAALLEVRQVDRTINAAPSVTVDRAEAGSLVIGAAVTVQAASAQSVFNWEVREPLERLYKAGLDREVVILVDALDEARLAGQGDTIFNLLAQVTHWPPRVRFLLTSRPEQPILRTLRDRDPALVTIALGSGAERDRSRDDVRRYVAARAAGIAANIAPGFSADALGDRMSAKADGNFLWAVFAMSTLASARDPITALTLDDLPPHLSPLYLQFVERLANKDRNRWFDKHALVLATLVVAQEAMTEAQLSLYSGVEPGQATRIVFELTQLLDRGERNGETTWSIYHRSFIDFLVTPAESQEYACDESRAHRRIVDTWLGAVGRAGTREWARGDDYARRNIAAHLFALRTDDEMRGHLLALVSREWMELKGSSASFAHDVALAAEAAAAHSSALVQQIRAAGVLTTLHAQAQAAPVQLLAVMARLGDVDGALSYLALSTPEAKAQAAIVIAAALVENDPLATLHVLADVTSSAPRHLERVAALRARALASLGRFDDLLPLVPAILEDDKAPGSVITSAVAAGRLDVAERVALGVTHWHTRAELVMSVVEAALAQDDVDTACRIASAVVAEDPKPLIAVARRLRSFAPTRGIQLVLQHMDAWRRETAIALLAADAALDSDQALDSLLLLLAERDTRRDLEHAVTNLAEGGHFDVATHVSERYALDAAASVMAIRVRLVAETGDVAQALALADERGASADFPWYEFAKVLARHGSIDQVVSALTHLAGDDGRIDRVLNVAARERDRPGFVTGVLERLGETVIATTRANVAARLVELGSGDAAFGIVDAAPVSMRNEILLAIAKAAIDSDHLDEALRAYERALPERSSLTDGLAMRLVDADRIDDALAVTDGVGYVRDAVLGRLIDRLVDMSRIADAIHVAGGRFEKDALLERVLVRDPSLETFAAIERKALVIDDDVVDGAEQVLTRRGTVDAANRVRALRVRLNRVDDDDTVAVARAAAIGDQAGAGPEAVRRSLAAISASAPYRTRAPVVTAIAAAAVHVLPYEEAEAAIRPLGSRMHPSGLVAQAALTGDARAAMSIAAGGDRWFEHDAIARAAIDRLVLMRQWECALQVARAGGDPSGQEELVRYLLEAAGWDGQLSAALGAVRAVVTDVDSELSRLAAAPTPLSVRMQAVASLGEHAYERRRLIDDLVGLRQFARAAEVAGRAGDDLGKVLASSVMAGMPIDIARAPLEPQQVSAAFGTAAEKLLAAGYLQEAADFARRARNHSWERSKVAEGLASLRLDLALEVARSEGASDQDDLHITVAAAVAPRDVEAAGRVLRNVRDPARRAQGVAAVIEALLSASQVPNALKIKQSSTLLPTSLDAQSRVAAAWLDAGQKAEAEATVAATLQLVTAVPDDWQRESAFAELARAVLRRGRMDLALAIKGLLAPGRQFHAWTAIDIALQRARTGDRDGAAEDVKGEMDLVRQWSDRSVREEAELAGLLISLRGWHSLRQVVDDLDAASRPNQSVLPFLLADLTGQLGGWNVGPAWPRPLERVRRWSRRWRATHHASRLLARAEAAAAADPDEHMRLQAHARLASRYMDLGERRKALEVARLAEDASRWPATAAPIHAVRGLGDVHRRAGHDARALEYLQNVLDAVVGFDDLVDHAASLSAGRLLGAVGAPARFVDRLIVEATREGHYRTWEFVTVLVQAAEGDGGRAARIGRALVDAVSTAPSDSRAALVNGVVQIGANAGDEALLNEAEQVLVRQLDPRAAVDAMATAADRLAAGGHADGHTWALAALQAIGAYPEPQAVPRLRARLGHALWRLGSREQARRELSTALNEVRQASRAEFFAVLSAWVAILEDDDRLPDVAQTMIDIERWWKHRPAD